jgi:hypothetical protein
MVRLFEHNTGVSRVAQNGNWRMKNGIPMDNEP